MTKEKAKKCRLRKRLHVSIGEKIEKKVHVSEILLNFAAIKVNNKKVSD